MVDNADDVASLTLKVLGPLGTYRFHKLVYYSQAWHLALHGEPLFPDEVEAWAQGPIVGRLYRRQAFEVDIWPAGDQQRLSDQTREVIHWVVDTYGSFTGEELSRMTRAEAPWRFARGRRPGPGLVQLTGRPDDH
ncbi:Panacea domain-containing protein [Frankia sp. AgKG'84/4]|uniref:Panacea domain-containing protein n=1 Tax=Frankia sp. AgKG'84/4 TaxID=573490 RepID=UPI00200C27BE|nr:type II toxin-antitoxin system antitoxin SocA domain-containing protein [Frankia sp. AgKG'84/4]MCL9794476.1 DUF4065 domain-containing protein [Frankia sp. AgKG'84/4]